MSSQVVELVGRGSVALSPACHLATGGEASVYRSGDTVVKVYLDAQKMSRDSMVDKIAALRPLRSDMIVAPEGAVVDRRGTPVGLYARYVEGEPLPRVFNTAFWRREGFGVDQANRLVDRMREVVVFAHSHKAVMVDANELNWRVSSKADPVPHVFDVDSWAVGKWRATVIMPSIRDPHSAVFDEKSDWFSWAVITFQLYTGIHPYKGYLPGHLQDEWGRRMRENLSVFSSGVKLNSAVRSFGTIPGALRSWYEAVFQRKERCAPPSPYAVEVAAQPAAVVQHVSATPSSGILVSEKLYDVHPVQRTWPSGTVLVQVGKEQQVWDARRRRRLFGVPSDLSSCEVVRVVGGWVMASLSRGVPSFYFAGEAGEPPVKMDSCLSGHALFRYENRLFLASGDSLMELASVRLALPTIAVVRSTSILHPQAVQWFDGVGVEKTFQSTFVVTPIGEAACATVRAPELDGLHVVSARAGRRFAAFVAEDKGGNLCKIELVFDADHLKYSATRTLVDDGDLNMALLPKGVGATIARDGELVVFVPTSGSVKRVADAGVSRRMLLGNFDDMVVYLDERGSLWSLKMK